MTQDSDILFTTENNPAPDDVTAGHFTGHGGIRLRYAVCRAAVSIAKGTVVIVQGRNECIEKYYETIRALNDQGLWVAIFDLRGQGGSDRVTKDPSKGHVHRFSDYCRDLELFLEQVVLPDTRLPFFLLAHSTGGLIALDMAPRLANRIDRMAVTAPFVGLAPQPLSAGKIFWLTRLLSWTGLGLTQLQKRRAETFDDNPVTSDPQRYARNRAIIVEHPQLDIGPPTARWIYECLKAMGRVLTPAHLYAITVPTIVIAPVRDTVVSFPAQEWMSQYFRASRFIPIAGSRHEILQEQERYRAQAMAAIAAFFPGSDPEGQAQKMLEADA
ncbi:alpha/beta fold hydrolase [Rhizobium halophytocola]|uniref:Lysophospholipase n=1 Tax=Rhizobium halophytocola TaxID=735519 RepID=A0ABS4DTB9_9HYPH|nr:alpha/beta hydrolase [Rhizobium halophytocola]MBP1848934.1 lysophospholipase [Rhizobium halophytocola]